MCDCVCKCCVSRYVLHEIELSSAMCMLMCQCSYLFAMNMDVNLHGSVLDATMCVFLLVWDHMNELGKMYM